MNPLNLGQKFGVEINDESRGMHNEISNRTSNLVTKLNWKLQWEGHIYLIIVMYTYTWSVWLNGRVFLYKLNCCGFESCSCHVKGAVTVPKTALQGIAPNNNKKVVFKSSVPFTYCISEINRWCSWYWCSNVYV